MMARTIQELRFLASIRPHGEEANALISYKSINFAYLDWKDLSYGIFLNDQKKVDGEMIEKEHISFLTYWLNRFIFCISSQKVTKNFLDLAKIFLARRKLAIAPIILAHLYRSMKELVDSRFIEGAGPP